MVVNADLLKYIRDSLAIKTPLEQIKKNLLGAGWPNSLVDEAINYLNQTTQIQEPKNFSNKQSLPFTRPESEYKSKPQRRHAPTGIIILASFGFIGLALSLLAGLALVFLSGTIDSLLSSISPLLSSMGQISMIGGISILISDILAFFMFRGLLKGQNWARAITIIFEIIGIFGTLTVMLLVGSDYYVYGGISLAVSLIITIYLLFNRKVKDFFNKK